MSIRTRIILIVLPLLVAAVVLAGMSSYFVAARSVTRIATDFLDFKASELEKYADNQWGLLAANGLAGRPDMVAAAQAAVESFAGSILGNDTEAIIAVDAESRTTLRAGPGEPEAAERAALAAIAATAERGFGRVLLGGVERVASWFPFAPFAWTVFVTEERAVFYGSVESILRTTLAILGASALAAVLLLFLLAGYLTRPLQKVSRAMRRIIESNDLSERVEVEYRDEIGELSHSFNLMLAELDQAYRQIKSYAFDAAVARKKEFKIRNIFQLYVPKEVIDQVFSNPEGMLVGSKREVAVLFSDIRNFTTISEGLEPEVLVENINRYFDVMVGAIMDRGGTVDKYIGDAIMAVFGAPASHGDDALRAVLAGLEMTRLLEEFNAAQRERGKPAFPTGVGVNFGEVTVGNIGCDRKMNYTVLGDEVNLASRVEGLTKTYKEPVLVTDSVQARIADTLPCRLVDTVRVKGKSEAVRIYATRSRVAGAEREAWEIHEESMRMYYGQAFAVAATGFEKVLSLLPGDEPAAILRKRCLAYMKSPPGPDWDGVESLTEK
jgi:class 3 adenylate cyclase/HAMP domain-containing protein